MVVPLVYIAANAGDHDDNGSGPRRTMTCTHFAANAGDHDDNGSGPRLSFLLLQCIYFLDMCFVHVHFFACATFLPRATILPMSPFLPIARRRGEGGSLSLHLPPPPLRRGFRLGRIPPYTLPPHDT